MPNLARLSLGFLLLGSSLAMAAPTTAQRKSVRAEIQKDAHAYNAAYAARMNFPVKSPSLRLTFKQKGKQTFVVKAGIWSTTRAWPFVPKPERLHDQERDYQARFTKTGKLKLVALGDWKYPPLP